MQLWVYGVPEGDVKGRRFGGRAIQIPSASFPVNGVPGIHDTIGKHEILTIFLQEISKERRSSRKSLGRKENVFKIPVEYSMQSRFEQVLLVHGVVLVDSLLNCKLPEEGRLPEGNTNLLNIIKNGRYGITSIRVEVDGGLQVT